jgi:hypothetical protein
MLTLRRKKRAAAETVGFPESDEALFAEIEEVTDANRRRHAHERDRRLLALRNEAGIRLLQSVAAAPAYPEPDSGALPGDGLPEVGQNALSPGLLRAAILRNGCLLVRGLIPREDALALAAKIDRSFAERENHDAGERFDRDYYDPFQPDPRVGENLSRQWIKSGGGVLAIDAPMLSFDMHELFARAGLPQLVAGYLGERPLITAHKTTLRKADPSVSGAWHQDGKFMGAVRALNLWLSLSRCGDVAPGLDIVPRRIDHHVTTQTDEAWLEHAVSQRVAEEAAGDVKIVRPMFEPGDALLFDELFLHKTGSDPSMPNPRFAIENWFFGPSSFPVDYAPLAV